MVEGEGSSAYDENMTYKAHVITCSDRAYADVYEDRSGPILRGGLRELGFDVAQAEIVPDDLGAIQAAILRACAAGNRVVMTTGGTGVSPCDLTVEATKPLVAFEIPGLMEEVRRIGAQKTQLALLSRGVAGVVVNNAENDRAQGESTLVINAPGSRGGARDTIAAIGGALMHLVGQLDGADHETD